MISIEPSCPLSSTFLADSQVTVQNAISALKPGVSSAASFSPLDCSPDKPCYVDIQREGHCGHELAYFARGLFFGLKSGSPFKRSEIISWRPAGEFHERA